MELSRCCHSLYTAEYDKGIKEKEMGRLEGVVRRAKMMGDHGEGGEGQEEVVKYLSEKLEKLKEEVDDLKKQEVSSAAALPPLLPHDPLTTYLGLVVVWAVDLRWGHVAPDGSLVFNRNSIPGEQIAQVEKTLMELPGSVRVLVLALEYPLVDVPRDKALMSKVWSKGDEDQSYLLQLAMRWKSKGPEREVVVLAGGMCMAMETVIRHVNPWKGKHDPGRYDWEMVQMVTGPVSDRWDSSTTTIKGDGIMGEEKTGGVFEFSHRFPTPDKHYLEVVFKSEGVEKTSIYKQWVPAIPVGVRALLGPVIGEVTCTTAVVLVEVEHKAPVICIACDALSGKQHKLTR